MKKRIFSLLLCLVMVLSLIPSMVFAGDGTPATLTPITNIALEFDTAPIAGKLPEECLTMPTVVTTPAGAVELVTDSIGWRNEGGYAVSGAFEAGKAYYFVVCLKCKDGYQFDFDKDYNYTGTATVNGNSNVIAEAGMEANDLWIWTRYECKDTTQISITKMELTVAAPEAGKKPSDCITVPGFTTDPADAAVLDETRFCWYTPEGEYFNGVFQEGETYEYYMEFSPKVGYKFNFDGDEYTGDIKVNGGEVKYTESTGAGWTKLACAVLVKCGPDTRTPITDFALTIDAPQAGKTAADCKLTPTITTTPANGATLTEDYSWHTADGHYFNGIFKAGETYLYELRIKCEDGYTFPHSGDEYTGTALVNGEKVYYCEVSSTGDNIYVGMLVECISGAPRAPITDIALTIDVPEAGKTAAECMFVPNITTTPANAAEFEVVDTGWYNGNGHGQFNGTFEAGKEYIYEVCLKCKDGYYFPGSGGDYAGTVSVNGEEAYYAEINNAGADAPSLYAYIGMIMTPGGTPAFLKGDVNGDGEVTDADAVYLLYNTFFGDDEYPVNQPCDFNGDGEVTDADAVYLLYYTFFGDEDYPLH